MNSDEKQNKKNKKEEVKIQKIEQKKFQDINNNLKKQINKLNHFNNQMDKIIDKYISTHNKLFKKDKPYELNILKNNVIELEANARETQLINENKLIKKEKSIFSKTKDFLKNNRKTIDNYLITPLIAAVSFPLGALYHFRKKSKGEKLSYAGIGVICSLALTVGTIKINYSEPTQTVYENNNIEMEYQNSYSKANSVSSVNYVDLIKYLTIVSTTNIGFFEVMNYKPEYNKTILNIHSKENKSSISATYEFEGFKKIENIVLEDLNNPKELYVNTRYVNKNYANRKQYVDEVKEIYKENKPNI